MESSNKRGQLENWKQEVLKYRIKDTERAINVCAKIEAYAQEQKDFENLVFSKAYPYVTISQGICQDTPVPGNKSWDFLHAADEMLYNVKRKTRNDICIGSSFNQEADKKKC